MSIVWKILGVITFALACVGAISLGLAISDREPPIVYEEARALSDSVPQGGTIEVQFTVFRERVCRTGAKRWLTDSSGQRHAIPSYTVGLRTLAGRETYRRTITIPDAAATGPALYRVSIDFECNFLHRLGWPVHLDSPPIRFVVTARTFPPLPPVGSERPGGDG